MTFRRLSPETKKQLLDNVRAYEPQDQPEVIQAMLRQSGVASDFIRHVIGKETDPMVPHNKRLNPIQTK